MGYGMIDTSSHLLVFSLCLCPFCLSALHACCALHVPGSCCTGTRSGSYQARPGSLGISDKSERFKGALWRTVREKRKGPQMKPSPSKGKTGQISGASGHHTADNQPITLKALKAKVWARAGPLVPRLLPRFRISRGIDVQGMGVERYQRGSTKPCHGLDFDMMSRFTAIQPASRLPTGFQQLLQPAAPMQLILYHFGPALHRRMSSKRVKETSTAICSCYAFLPH